MTIAWWWVAWLVAWLCGCLAGLFGCASSCFAGLSLWVFACWLRFAGLGLFVGCLVGGLVVYVFGLLVVLCFCLVCLLWHIGLGLLALVCWLETCMYLYVGANKHET